MLARASCKNGLHGISNNTGRLQRFTLRCYFYRTHLVGKRVRVSVVCAWRSMACHLPVGSLLGSCVAAYARWEEACLYSRSPAHSWVWHERRSSLTITQMQGDNYLTSTIPASWLHASSLPKLAVLGLAQNQLVGTIPTPQPGCGLCGYKVRAPAQHSEQTEPPFASCILRQPQNPLHVLEIPMTWLCSTFAEQPTKVPTTSCRVCARGMQASSKCSTPLCGSSPARAAMQPGK